MLTVDKGVCLCFTHPPALEATGRSCGSFVSTGPSPVAGVKWWGQMGSRLLVAQLLLTPAVPQLVATSLHCYLRLCQVPTTLCVSSFLLPLLNGHSLLALGPPVIKDDLVWRAVPN